MQVCMYVCMYACTYVRTYVCTRVWMCARTCTYNFVASMCSCPFPLPPSPFFVVHEPLLLLVRQFITPFVFLFVLMITYLSTYFLQRSASLSAFLSFSFSPHICRIPSPNSLLHNRITPTVRQMLPNDHGTYVRTPPPTQRTWNAPRPTGESSATSETILMNFKSFFCVRHYSVVFWHCGLNCRKLTLISWSSPSSSSPVPLRLSLYLNKCPLFK